jgi:hypothetical protein
MTSAMSVSIFLRVQQMLALWNSGPTLGVLPGVKRNSETNSKATQGDWGSRQGKAVTEVQTPWNCCSNDQGKRQDWWTFGKTILELLFLPQTYCMAYM